MSPPLRAVALLVILGAALLAAPTPASAATPVTVWTWNVAGHAMHRGSTTDGMVAAAVASIINRDADFVVLTELCDQQYDAIIAGLVARDWPADPTNFSRFQAHDANTPGAYCRGDTYGLALFSRQPLGPAARFLLPQDDRTEQRFLLCAAPTARPTLRACAVHIGISNAVDPATGRPYNVGQLDAALAHLEKYNAAGQTVLLAGDLNAQPSYGRLDSWYAPSADTPANGGNIGAYRELDDTDSRCPGYGEWTATGPAVAPPCADPQAKIDHVFVREDRIAGAYSADSLNTSAGCTGIAGTAAYPAGSCSDHRILVGTVLV